MKNIHTTFFMISNFVLISSICFFIFGVSLSQYGNIDGLKIIIISFISVIISTYTTTKMKIKLNSIIDYGRPVWNSAEYIKKIIEQTNTEAVKSLQKLVKEQIESELKKVIKNAR